jgi:hypothetical protein
LLVAGAEVAVGTGLQVLTPNFLIPIWAVAVVVVAQGLTAARVARVALLLVAHQPSPVLLVAQAHPPQVAQVVRGVQLLVAMQAQAVLVGVAVRRVQEVESVIALIRPTSLEIQAPHPEGEQEITLWVIHLLLGLHLEQDKVA